MLRKNKYDIEKLQNDLAKSFQLPLKDMGIGKNNYNVGTVGMDPFAQMLGQASDLGALAHLIKDDPKAWQSYTDFVIGMALSFGENLSNSTYMAGFSKAMEDVTYAKRAWRNDGDDKFVKKYFSRYAASFMPTAFRQGGKFFDDNKKNINKEFNELLYGFIVDNVKTTDYNIVGEPIYEVGFLNKYKKDSPIETEIKRLNPELPKYNYYFTYKDAGKLHTVFPQSVEMTSEEQSLYKELSGKLSVEGGFTANNALKTMSGNKVVDGFKVMFESDYYKNSPDIVKSKMVSAVISSARTQAKNILKNDPMIAERILNKGRDKLVTDIETKQPNLIMENTNDNINN